MKNILKFLVFFWLCFAQVSAQNDENLVGFVAADSPINVRERPSSNGAIVSSLPPNMSVSILDESEDGAWLMIETLDGQMGWVSASLMRVMESAIPADLVAIEPENAAQLEEITQLASTLTTRMAFSPDGRLLGSIFWDGTIKIYDVRTKILIITMTSHLVGVSDIEFSPNGREMASSGDGTVTIWNTETWGEIASFQGHSDEVVNIAYSPNGEQIASAGRDGSLIIWDVQTGERLHVMELRIAYVSDMVFSPDGTKLAASGDYQTSVVRVWDTATGEQLWSRSLGGNLHIDFSPDERLILLRDSNSLTIEGYDPNSGVQQFSFTGRVVTGASSLDINPSGRLVAAGTVSHAGFLLAEIETRDTLFSDDSASEFPNTGLSLVFSPDGRLLATSDNLHGIFLWGVHGG
jgi:WD40 repeat protein